MPGKPRIGHADHFRSGGIVLRRKHNLLPYMHFYTLVSKTRQGSDFRASGIQQNRRCHTHIFPRATKGFQILAVHGMIAMRKIHTCHIHSCVQHLLQYRLLRTGRSQCTYDLCTSHSLIAPLSQQHFFMALLLFLFIFIIIPDFFAFRKKFYRSSYILPTIFSCCLLLFLLSCVLSHASSSRIRFSGRCASFAVYRPTSPISHMAPT